MPTPAHKTREPQMRRARNATIGCGGLPRSAASATWNSRALAPPAPGGAPGAECDGEGTSAAVVIAACGREHQTCCAARLRARSSRTSSATAVKAAAWFNGRGW